MPNVGPYIYTTLTFLALLGAPYIYDISSLRVNVMQSDPNPALLFVTAVFGGMSRMAVKRNTIQYGIFVRILSWALGEDSGL